jgi:hypothetical protein
VSDYVAAYGSSLNLSATPQNGQPNSTLSTYQGQQVTSLAAAIYDCYSQFLALSSQVDPQYAQGMMQDGIGNIYFMSRYPASGTQVLGVCTGLTGTVIGVGVPAAQDANGNIYSCSDASGNPITIVQGGSAAVFTNMQTGPIAFAPFTTGGPALAIYQTTAGWDGISNVVAGTLGANSESTQQFETRRQLSVAVNSNGLTASIRAAILALIPTSYPASVYVVDNPTNVPSVQGGITLPPNSVYVAAFGYLQYAPWAPVSVVNGGVTTVQYPISSVAQAMFARKSLGCSYAPSVICTVNTTCSTTTMVINNPTSGVLTATMDLLNSAGQPYLSSGGLPLTATAVAGSNPTSTVTLNYAPASPITAGTTVWWGVNNIVSDPSYPSSPQPTYSVTFTIPIPVYVNVQVTLAAAGNPPTVTQAAAMLAGNVAGYPGLPAAFSGTDGLPAVSQIGAAVYGSRFYGIIAATFPGVPILGVVVSTSPITSGATGPLLQAININQIPVIGTVTVVTQ